eukprot:1673145-Rhodomonas_salina.4
MVLTFGYAATHTSVLVAMKQLLLLSATTGDASPSQIQETTSAAHLGPGVSFLVFDFALYRTTHTLSDLPVLVGAHAVRSPVLVCCIGLRTRCLMSGTDVLSRATRTRLAQSRLC